MTMEGFDALEEQASTRALEYESTEYPSVTMAPRVAVIGEIIGMTFRGNVADTQNLLGQEGMNDDFSFILKNPSVQLGRVIEANERPQMDPETGETTEYPLARHRYRDDDYPNEGEYVDFRIIGDDFDVDEVGDGVFLNYGSSATKYAGSFVDGISDDAIEVFQGGNAGLAIAQGLDVDGGQTAYYDTENDEIVRGLVEYPPDESDDLRKRVPTTPLVHPDLRGEEIVLVLQYGDEYNGNRAHIGRVFLRDDNDITKCTELTQGNEEHVSDVSWESLDNAYPPALEFGSESDDGGTDASQDEPSDDFDALATDDGPTDDSPDAPSKADLTSGQVQFVDQMAKKAVRETPSGADDPLEAVFGDPEAVVQEAIDGGEISGDGVTATQLAALASETAAEM